MFYLLKNHFWKWNQNLIPVSSELENLTWSNLKWVDNIIQKLHFGKSFGIELSRIIKEHS